MNAKSISIVAVVCLGILLSATLPAQNTQSAADGSAKRWQHLAVSSDAGEGIGDQELSRRIIQLGNDGWELVDVESIVKDGTTTKMVYCFKKPRR